MTLKRLPWFELSIFLIVVLIGWAAFRSNQIQKEIEKYNKDIGAQQKLQTDFIAVTNAFKKVQQLFEGEDGMELPQPGHPLEEEFKIREVFALQAKYRAIADEVESSSRELAQLLNELKFKGSKASEPFRQKSREFGDWLEEQNKRAKQDRFQARSLALKERIDREQSASKAVRFSLAQDLATLLDDIDRVYTNLLNVTAPLLTNFWKPPPSAKFNDQLKNAEDLTARLREIAKVAETDSQTIQSFLETYAKSDYARRRLKQEAVLELLRKPLSALEKPLSALEFASAAGVLSGGTNGPSGPISEPSPPSLQGVAYILIVALTALAVFLMVGLYRRMVVAPLSLKLVESETMNKLAHFGQLASGLAHEIRNPLTAIGARLYTLQKGLAEDSPEFQDATVIRNEMRRLDRIVKDFLTLARPAEPKLVPMSAEPLLKKTHELLAPLFETQSVQLTLGPVAEGQFRGDEEQLKQVLINLSQNAADSMEGKGGPIVLRARKDRTKIKGRETDAIIIEVEDAGPGIPPEIQERLFDPFFSTKEHGTGLGLAIAARIVDKHGGALTFDTQLNRGTTFGVVLPLYNKAP